MRKSSTIKSINARACVCVDKNVRTQKTTMISIIAQSAVFLCLQRFVNQLTDLLRYLVPAFVMREVGVFRCGILFVHVTPNVVIRRRANSKSIKLDQAVALFGRKSTPGPWNHYRAHTCAHIRSSVYVHACNIQLPSNKNSTHGQITTFYVINYCHRRSIKK